MKKFMNVLIIGSMALIVNACGFHLPNQTKMSESIPNISLCGDYHDKFYKLVKRDLTVNGVNIIESCDFDNSQDSIPQLMVPAVTTEEYVVSVDSKAQAIEYNIIVKSNATLLIKNHRPITIRNSLTRSTLNKAGHSLARENESRLLIQETTEELANQLVMRIGYLGRLSDPDAQTLEPADLVNAEGETPISVKDNSKPLTLIEALQKQDQVEQQNATRVTLDTLNNGNTILDNPKLPPVEVNLVHDYPLE